MRDYNEDIINYADGYLRSYWFHRNRLQDLLEKKTLIETEMIGVKSPQIKSPEEAQYQRSKTPYRDKRVALLEKKDEVDKEIMQEVSHIQKIETFIAEQPGDMAAVMEMRYIEGTSLEKIGQKVYQSSSTVWRNIRNGLLKFPTC